MSCCVGLLEIVPPHISCSFFFTSQKFNTVSALNHFCLDVAWVTQRVSLDEGKERRGAYFYHWFYKHRTTITWGKHGSNYRPLTPSLHVFFFSFLSSTNLLAGFYPLQTYLFHSLVFLLLILSLKTELDSFKECSVMLDLGKLTWRKGIKRNVGALQHSALNCSSNNIFSGAQGQR